MEVWNRRELTQEPEVGLGAIRFAYGTAVGRVLARGILCRRVVSQIYAAWQRSPLSRGKVRRFLRRYKICVEDCETQDFSCFNDFFTRKRKCYVNQTAEHELPAIADSKLLALPIAEGSRFCVKGVEYTLSELLENDSLAAEYAGGLCLIFRLTPDDYHRYVYPDAGRQTQTVAIPGVLHTVNPLAGSLRVYRRNSRRYTLLRTVHFGDAVQLEVGALLVGKIRNHREDATSFEKLQEKGYFEYGGSTVILLLKAGVLAVDEDIAAYSARGIETKVRIGERIGRKL